MDLDLEHLIVVIEQDESTDPIDRVAAAAGLRDQIEQLGDELLDHFVKEARDQGCSWNQIGEALGVTRQAAQQRQGGLIGRLVAGLAKGRFSRFTPRARSAVVAAQTAARDRNHGWIGTEHLLLGLYAGGDNLAVAALDRLGVEQAVVARRIDELVPPGDSRVRGHLPFTPRSKKALELGMQEARELGHDYLGTEHIVLALRRLDEGVAADVLAELGVDVEVLRSTIVGMLASGWKPPSSP